jgi:hypothetical protein
VESPMVWTLIAAAFMIPKVQKTHRRATAPSLTFFI